MFNFYNCVWNKQKQRIFSRSQNRGKGYKHRRKCCHWHSFWQWYFDLNTKVYNETVFDGKYEITSLLGNLTTKDNEPYLHLHINFSGEDCVTYGGHFVEGTVTAVCEIILTELDGQIPRYLDEVSGLNVMNLK